MNKNPQLRFEAKKGQRLHRYFWAVTITNPKVNLWWNTTKGGWEEIYTNPSHGYSTHAPCRTLKSFKRMLRKYPEIVGHACLVNRYKGFDIYA